MNPALEYQKHIKVDYEDQTTREAFSDVKILAKLQKTADWVAPVERAIWRSNLRDVNEQNTSIGQIGGILLAFELNLAERLITANGTSILIRIQDHYLPSNQEGAKVALADQRISWQAAFDDPTDTIDGRVRKAALHRVRGRLFHTVAKQALNCDKPAERVARDWVAMIHRYAERIVDEGQDETEVVADMKRLISRRQAAA